MGCVFIRSVQQVSYDQIHNCGNSDRRLLLSIPNTAILKQWISENRDLLKPPVGNKNLYADAGDYIVMIVGGPNARKDFHYNETEELFYQLEGNINVRIQEDGKAVDIPIHEGEMFLLPARVPHRPERPAGSVGLVIECKRPEENVMDGLMWFCDKCNNPLHEYKFHLDNI